MNAEEEEGSVDGGRVEKVDGAAETWLIGVEDFSRGLPCLSKNESAALATSAADMDSTSFPNICLMLEGIVFKRCSLRMLSIVTSLESSTSWVKYWDGVKSCLGISPINFRVFCLRVGPY